MVSKTESVVRKTYVSTCCSTRNRLFLHLFFKRFNQIRLNLYAPNISEQLKLAWFSVQMFKNNLLFVVLVMHTPCHFLHQSRWVLSDFICPCVTWFWMIMELVILLILNKRFRDALTLWSLNWRSNCYSVMTVNA